MSPVNDFPRIPIAGASGQAEALFGEWLALRSHRYIDRPGSTLEDETAAENQKRDIARRLASMPTQQPGLILHKIQILEAELLEIELTGGHTLHALVAGIKADIQDLAEAAE